MATARIIVIAMGPSLKREHIEDIKASGHDTFIVNELFRFLPEATYHYAADEHWWRAYGHEIDKTYTGTSFTLWDWVAREHKATQIYGENKLPNSRGGLREQWLTTYHGGTSIHTAGSLAYHLGYRDIAFVGVDCKGTGHFLQKNERAANMWRSSPYSAWAVNMTDLYKDLYKCGCKVSHCSPDSDVEWDYTPLEDVL